MPNLPSAPTTETLARQQPSKATLSLGLAGPANAARASTATHNRPHLIVKLDLLQLYPTFTTHSQLSCTEWAALIYSHDSIAPTPLNSCSNPLLPTKVIYPTTYSWRATMPGTPSVRDDHVATTNDTDAAWLQHFSCPPEEVCDDSWMQSQIRATTSDEPEPEATLSPRTSYPTPPSSSRRDTTAAQENVTRSNRIMGVNRPVDVLSPAVSEEPVNTDTKPQTPYIEETPDRIKPRTSSKTERRNQQYTAMDYEAYSSIRVSTPHHVRQHRASLTPTRYPQPTRRPSCGPVASSKARKHPNGKNTTC